MRIVVSAPTRPGSTSGNATTSQRWARRLTELGHTVIEQSHDEESIEADVVVVLHAKRGAAAIRRYAALSARPKIVVGFGGTDVYGDLNDPDIVSSLALGDAFVVLQPLAAERLGEAVRGRVWTIHQAVEDLPRSRAASEGENEGDTYQAVVLSHLREVKDPLRAGEAACLIPSETPIRVVHVGAAHDESWELRARDLAQRCDKYEWLGEYARPDALALLDRSDVLVITSLSEGGANVVSEALALGKPVIASRIDGNVGMLGEKHPGYFEALDTAGLATLLRRFATDETFRHELRQSSESCAGLVDPVSERLQWEDLLTSVS